jgi:hypothetical protein
MDKWGPLTDEERAAIKGMPEAVAAGWLRARRKVPPLYEWAEAGRWDELRAFLDEKGIDLAAGDPVKGQRIADFNDMIIDQLKARRAATTKDEK